MAASMYRYLQEASSDEKQSLAAGFTPAAFKTQVIRILTMFDMHKDIDDSWRKIHLFKNPTDDILSSGTELSREFVRLTSDASDKFSMLQPWDASSLPFNLRRI